MDTPKTADDLRADDVARRRAAAEYLAQHEVPPGAILPLVRAAGDPDTQVREWAAAALEGMGPPAVQVLGDLIGLLDVESEDTAYWAATLIGRLGPSAAPAVEKLAAVLGNGPIAVRQRAAWALEKIGPGAACAAPALSVAAQAADPRLARQAGRALDAIGRR